MKEKQPERKPPPQIPSDMLAFNRQIIEDFRANKGQLSGPMAGRKFILLTTKGAKSGRPRTAVLGFGKDGDRYVLVASGNGAPAHPKWYQNLVANPKVTVEVGPEKFQARAHTADASEQERVRPLVPYFEGEQKKTSRKIPLVILEREKGF
ncbi:MAG: nitroreductase family deazaflavin-dependent oxidoreductase [Candidatus Dormibacteraeota bacterium]|nr:nitroreductase family deazaflavin-dependent oxidoreductase [Candidatus Dormibacteraeota bacterium]